MDAYTLHIATAFASAMMTISLLGLFIASPREYSLLDWSFAGLCFLATNGLTVLVFHSEQPIWVAPVLTNAFYFAGHCALLVGVRRYFGLKTHWQLGVGLALVIAAVHLLPWVQASVANRLLLFFPLLMLINSLTISVLWRYGGRELRLACMPLLVLELLFLLQLLLRTLILGTTSDMNLTYAGSQFFQTSGTLAIFVFLSLGTMACAMMVIRRQELELRQLTTTDPLTGWFNRRALNDIAVREFERSARTSSELGLLVLDIDHFKKINDTYGHVDGDAALKHVTNTCALLLRGYDYLFRFGGEEFVILLPGSDHECTRKLANRLRLKIQSEPVTLGQDRVALTISIGVAQRRERDQSWLQILERADSALYHAKQSGRDRVAFHNGLELSQVS